MEYKYKYCDEFGNVFLMNNLFWKKFMINQGCNSVLITDAETNRILLRVYRLCDGTFVKHEVC